MYNDNNGNGRAYHHSSSTKKYGQQFLERDLAIFAKCEAALKDMHSSMRNSLKPRLDLINYVMFAKEATKEQKADFYRVYPDVLNTCTIYIHDYNL